LSLSFIFILLKTESVSGTGSLQIKLICSILEVRPVPAKRLSH